MIRIKTCFVVILMLFAGLLLCEQFVYAKDKDVKKTDKTIVYYFHEDTRCKSCVLIEKYTKEALENNYANAMKEKKVVFKPVSVDKYDNEHYMYDYNLYTKSVVLSKIKNGKEVKYKNLDKIWTLLGNKEKFIKYIKNEINSFNRN